MSADLFIKLIARESARMILAKLQAEEEARQTDESCGAEHKPEDGEAPKGSETEKDPPSR
jgi:hypothetical protein